MRRRLCAVVYLTVVAGVCQIGRAGAEGVSPWSGRQRIPGSHDEAHTPYLVADRSRTVHAVYSQPLGGPDTEVGVLYTRWTPEGGWIESIDVLLPPYRRQAHVQGAFLDEKGVLHVLFFGGDDRDANMYYARVAAASASHARTWSSPELVGIKARTPRTAALVADGRGTLQVLYGGNRDGIGLYTVHSRDGGESWSAPVPIFLTGSEERFPWALTTSWDERGRLHAVWTVAGIDGNGKEIRYARMDAVGGPWTDSVILTQAKPGQYEVDWPSITAHGHELSVIYNDFHPPKRMARTSADGGETWDESVEPFAPSRGEYGPVDFVVDSANQLHAVFGDRGRGLNVWHSSWRGGRWSEPEPIAPATEAERFAEGALTFHPSQPRAVVSQGNLLLVVWKTDPGFHRNGVWSSVRKLDSPELPVEALPRPVVATKQRERSSGATAQSHAAPSEPRPTHLPRSSNYGFWDHPATPLVAGFVPAAILILVVVLVGRWQRRHHR